MFRIKVKNLQRGRIKEINITEGDIVKKGDILCTLDDDEVEVAIKSPCNGRVEDIYIEEASIVIKEDLLFNIQKDDVEEEKIEEKIEENFYLNYGTISRRPKVEDRLFRSQLIDEMIDEVKIKLKDDRLAWLFENCFANTLDTTVYFSEEESETHIITGDIDAMWLRDSTCQVWPYMPYINRDVRLKAMVEGLINRQIKCVKIDPYANAFKKDISEPISKWARNDITEMKEELHERKWEINSLLFVIRLSHRYLLETNNLEFFDDSWVAGMKLIIKTLKEQQRLEDNGPYSFQRLTLDPADAVANNGFGQATKKNGMIHAIFRQDDANLLNLYVPDNIMAIGELKNLCSILDKLGSYEDMVEECKVLIRHIKKGVEEDAIVEHRSYGKIFAFEVDGFGSQIIMDDPTLPGLLNLPYMGYWDYDNIYENTRRMILSEGNPMYEKGDAGEGYGSAHYIKGRIWPMGTISRIFTSKDEEEIKVCLEQLISNHLHTGFIHETYNKDNSLDYTRPWFSWVNSYFGELVIYLLENYPQLVCRDKER